jgi:hypothetical protein
MAAETGTRRALRFRRYFVDLRFGHRHFISFVLATLMAGCTATTRYSGIEPTDISALRVGASRPQIDAALGKPTSEGKACSWVQRTYEFNLGFEPTAGLAILPAAAVAYVITAGLYGVADAGISHCIWKCQRGEAWVSFDSADTVTGYRFGWADAGSLCDCENDDREARQHLINQLYGKSNPLACE